jgi:hypothetical protein
MAGAVSHGKDNTLESKLDVQRKFTSSVAARWIRLAAVGASDRLLFTVAVPAASDGAFSRSWVSGLPSG